MYLSSDYAKQKADFLGQLVLVFGMILLQQVAAIT
jgi:hypothetical protein